jgi:toxic protein SymE
MKQKGKKNIRKLKVQPKHYQRAYNKIVTYPEIRLNGKWLFDCGFVCNEPVIVYCEEGELLIRRLIE